jgi:hypothetical protein
MVHRAEGSEQMVLDSIWIHPNFMKFHTSAASGQKNGQSDQKRNVKKRRSKYGKNRNGFSSLKENWTGSTGSSG